MAKETTDTTIGPGITIRAHLQSDEDINLAGRIYGRVDTKRGLTVEPGGILEAEVSSGTLDVFGTVNGPIAVIDRVTIHPGGRVTGEIRAPRVILIDGGKYRGHIDTDVQRQEVIDAVLDRLNEGPQALTVTGKPKWGGPKAFGSSG